MNDTEHFGKINRTHAGISWRKCSMQNHILLHREPYWQQKHKENQNQPRVMVRALMLQKILKE